MENVILREGRFGQYEQVNDSNLWINWTKQISAEGTTGRDRVPGPGVFYGQIREKDDPDTAYDCVVKCHLSEAFTEESRREVSEKRAAANIKLLKQARSPVHRGKADHDLAYHVVSSYSTEAIEPHGYSGRKRYILQPLELCSANLQNYMMSKGQYSPLPEENNYSVRKQLLKDIVCGLKFVHNKGYSHRKIEPTSILLTEDDQGNLVAKLSDFALVKEDNARYGDTTRLADPGSLGYIAPELQNRKEGDGSYKKSMDIFSLGIVAYQLMAVNCPASEHLPHPFDSQLPDQESTYDRMVRLQVAINEGKLPPKWQDGLDPQDAEACNLIECMLLRDPAMRLDVNEVLQHPFFWTPKERMKHLCDLSTWLRDRPHSLGLKISGIGKARSEQEVVTDALFPTLSVFNTSDWTHLATFDRGVLYSVFKDCQEDSDQQARIGSRSSFLASVVGNVWRHFTENEIKTHCLDAIRMAQPNNVATELSKAAIEDPLLHGAHQDELLAAYFQLKFPKLALMLKTMQEYFPCKDLPQPTKGMSACCRLFYQKHADPGLAEDCLEDSRLRECKKGHDFVVLEKGGKGKGCLKCARQEDHFCSKNYDGVGLLGPPSVPSFSRFAVLKRKESPLVRTLETTYPVLRDMHWSSSLSLTEGLGQADFSTLQAMFDSLPGEVERLLVDLQHTNANFDSLQQEQLSRPAPELQEQAQRLGQQLQVIKTQAAHMGQRQQQQQDGASDVAAGAWQALSAAADQQLQQMCASLSNLLVSSRVLLKKQGGALGVYTIVHSLDGEHNEGSDEYMLAKCWAHYPTPESLVSSAAIPQDADRGGYLLVPVPLKPTQQLRAAMDTMIPSTVPEMWRKLACLGRSRCSKVVRSFLGGESVQCHALHGPSWEPPPCELCHPSRYSGIAACFDHICTSTQHSFNV